MSACILVVALADGFLIVPIAFFSCLYVLRTGDAALLFSQDSCDCSVVLVAIYLGHHREQGLCCFVFSNPRHVCSDWKDNHRHWASSEVVGGFSESQLPQTGTGFVLDSWLQPSIGVPVSNLKSPCRFMMSAVFMAVPQPPVALLMSVCMRSSSTRRQKLCCRMLPRREAQRSLKWSHLDFFFHCISLNLAEWAGILEIFFLELSSICAYAFDQLSPMSPGWFIWI